MNEVSYEEEHTYVNKHGKITVGVFAILLVVVYAIIVFGLVIEEIPIVANAVLVLSFALFILNPLLFRKEEIVKPV